MSFTERWNLIQGELQAFQNAKLIAVSKSQPIERILEAYELGQRDFGENYVQELLEKARFCHERGLNDIRWHFIGHLQTNKVKALAPIVSAVHSVDSIRVAQELSKRWLALGKTEKLSVFLEVNVEAEPSKSGFSPEGLLEALPQFMSLAGLDWRGLMAVPSREGGRSGCAFRQLVALERSCRPLTRGELSMGMSEDYGVALREGREASVVWIRLGTALFGARER